MGDWEAVTPVSVESTLGYHSSVAGFLTWRRETGEWTVSGGQFDWGGRLQKSNGGAQRYPQDGWKPSKECKGRRVIDCEIDISSRDESRA